MNNLKTVQGKYAFVDLNSHEVFITLCNSNRSNSLLPNNKQLYYLIIVYVINFFFIEVDSYCFDPKQFFSYFYYFCYE